MSKEMYFCDATMLDFIIGCAGIILVLMYLNAHDGNCRVPHYLIMQRKKCILYTVYTKNFVKVLIPIQILSW